MKSRIRIAVLYGGPSAEHEVSLKSGAAIVANLSSDYEVSPVQIDKQNNWNFLKLGKTLPIEEAIRELAEHCDVAVLGVHGTFGEDGTLQALLEAQGLHHTGASAAASLLAFDYESKYTDGGANEVTPPENMSAETIQTIQDYAVRAHAALGCRGYSRTDMMVTETGIYMIETNTLPGLSEASILPKQIAEAGMSFGEMLDHIIVAAQAS